jgi:hypothetical protein
MRRARHLDEERMILCYYGEDGDRHAAEHLRDCGDCRAAYASLSAVLAAAGGLAVPEPGADYGERVWERLRPRLAELETAAARKERASPWTWRPRPLWTATAALAMLGIVTILAVLAFLAPPLARRRPPGPGEDARGREVLLLDALDDHLERSERFLQELAHSQDHAELQRRAGLLADPNRLYRLAAHQEGNAELAGLLDRLERVLLEVRHAPADPEVDRGPLEGALLFDLRLTRAELEDRRRLG